MKKISVMAWVLVTLMTGSGATSPAWERVWGGCFLSTGASLAPGSSSYCSSVANAFPVSRSNHGLGVWGNLLLVFGGETSTALAESAIFNTTSQGTDEGDDGGLDAEGGTISFDDDQEEGGYLLGDLWALDLEEAFAGGTAGANEVLKDLAWKQLSPQPTLQGVSPSARAESAVAVAEDEGRLVVFGGRVVGSDKGFEVAGDLWLFDLEGDGGWEEVPPWDIDQGDGPAPRYGASGTYYGGYFLVQGGAESSGSRFNDVWAYNLTAMEGGWTLLASGLGGGVASAAAVVPSGYGFYGDDMSYALVYYGGWDPREQENLRSAIALVLPEEESMNLYHSVYWRLDLYSETVSYTSGHSMSGDDLGRLWIYGGRYPSSDASVLDRVSSRLLVAAAYPIFSTSSGSVSGIMEYFAPDPSSATEPSSPGFLVGHSSVVWDGRLLVHGGWREEDSGDGIWGNGELSDWLWSLKVKDVGDEELELTWLEVFNPSRSFSMVHFALAALVLLVCMCLFVSSLRIRTDSTFMEAYRSATNNTEAVVYPWFRPGGRQVPSRQPGQGLRPEDVSRLPEVVYSRKDNIPRRSINNKNSVFPSPMLAFTASSKECFSNPQPNPGIVTSSEVELTGVSSDNEGGIGDGGHRIDDENGNGGDDNVERMESGSLSLSLEDSPSENGGTGGGKLKGYSATDRQGRAGGRSKVSWSSEVAPVEHSTDHMCAICLGDYDEGSVLRVMMPCGHRFHSGCVDGWLLGHGVCPYCKVNIEVDHPLQQAIDQSEGSNPCPTMPHSPPSTPALTLSSTARTSSTGTASGLGGGGGATVTDVSHRGSGGNN